MGSKRLTSMAMGRREDQQKQEPLWIAHTELASAPGHPFYEKLNELLDAERFDPFVEGLSAKFYANRFGRPSLLPGIQNPPVEPTPAPASAKPRKSCQPFDARFGATNG